MNEQTKKTLLGGVFLVLIIGNIILGMSLFNIKSNNSCSLIKDIFYYEQLENEIAEESSEIYDYYAMSSEAYDVNDFQDTIYYCEQSRKKSNTYSQKLREIKAKYPEEPSEILELRLEMLDTEIEYLFVLYQACEYTESAARAYEKGEYTSGDINIEGQNEQIVIHDNTVEKYFNLDAEYQQLKKEIMLS